MKTVSFSYDANSATFIGPQQALPSEQSVDERQADHKLVGPFIDRFILRVRNFIDTTYIETKRLFTIDANDEVKNF